MLIYSCLPKVECPCFLDVVIQHLCMCYEVVARTHFFFDPNNVKDFTIETQRLQAFYKMVCNENWIEMLPNLFTFICQQESHLNQWSTVYILIKQQRSSCPNNLSASFWGQKSITSPSDSTQQTSINLHK